MAFQSYLRTLGGLVLALAVLGLAVTVLVDPYRLFRWVEVEGLNQVKPKIYRHDLWAKSAAYNQAAPRTVVLGNSRFDIAIDPDSPHWPADQRPVFNHAIPGLGITSNAALARAILGERPQTTLVVGLDFLDFLTDRAVSPDDATLSTPINRRELLDYLGAVASLDSLGDAFSTLLAQRDPYAPTMTELGFNPLRQYSLHVLREGHFALADQRNRENFRNYLRQPKHILPDPDQTTEELAALKSIIDLARCNGSMLHLVIYPYHADILEGFHHAGLWPLFEDWKRIVAHMVGAGDGHIRLWDFSGYSEMTTERFPPPGDKKTQMKWYWETGHFKSALGDLVIQRIFMGNANMRFGRQVTAHTVARDIEAIRAERRAYLDAMPEEAQRVRDIFKDMGLSFDDNPEAELLDRGEASPALQG